MDVNGWQRTVGLLLVVCLCNGCCDDGGTEALLPGTSTAPERFVMATVPSVAFTGIFPSTLEVRISPDGEIWSAPRYPLMANCVLPIPVHRNRAPGLGASSTHYLAAAFGLDGQLYFSKSRNGIGWTRAQVATTVDSGLTSDSRPSVVYDRDENVWYAFVRVESSTYDGNLSFINLDGGSTMGAFGRVGTSAVRGAAVAYTGIPGARYITTYDQGQAMITFDLYESIPFDEVGRSVPSVTQGLSMGIVGSPWVSATLTQVFAATNRNSQTGFPTVGVNEIWEYDPAADEWSPLVTLQPADADHEGASVAGLRTNMIVASPAGQNTELWRLEEGPSGVTPRAHLTLQTRSIKPAALAFGTKNGGAPLTDVCGDGDLVSVFLRFRSFKRTVPPDPGDFDDAEDVELRVSHRTWTGFVDREYDANPNLPGVQAIIVRNATKNQSHMFNEGQPGSSWPELRFLMQPDEVVKVKLTGDDGDSAVDITYAELSAPQGAGNAKTTHTIDENGQPAYQLIYDANVSEAQ